MFRINRFKVLVNYGQKEFYKMFRPFMSEAFQCNEAWNNRLNHRIMKKIKLEDMYHELDMKFNQYGKVSAIDVDIFTNAINNGEHFDELEEIIHKFRLSSETGKILNSTHHGFIRTFLSYDKNEEDDLLRILDDRLNYGIFPDDYCNLLLMDTYIKKNEITSAAKVATMQMLQEDFTNILVKLYSLYSCHKYLLEPGVWNKTDVKEEELNKDDTEEIKIRVKYLRNPYFDDHFDLIEPYSLIGKTMKMIGELENNSVSNSYHLLGLILYKKWPNVLDFTKHLLATNGNINAGCLEEVEKFVLSLPAVNNEEGNKIEEDIDKIKNNLVKFKQNNLIVEKDLLNTTENQLKAVVDEFQQKIIEEQCQIYENWINKREDLLMEELEEIKRMEKIENVKKKKDEMSKKEQELFFFDLEDQLDLEIENKRVRYPPKWLGKKKKKRTTVEEYIPPEVVTKRVSK